MRLFVLDTGDLIDLTAFRQRLADKSTSADEGFGHWGKRIINGSRWNAWSMAHSDIVLRNLWPLRLDTSFGSRVAINFPWEFFYALDRWAHVMASSAIFENWTPTAFVRDGLLASGVPHSKIFIIPHGVAAEDVCPQQATGNGSNIGSDAKKSVLRHEVGASCGKDSFVLSYRCGVLNRKAVDLALDGYFRSFAREDRVCFIVHSAY